MESSCSGHNSNGQDHTQNYLSSSIREAFKTLNGLSQDDSTNNIRSASSSNYMDFQSQQSSDNVDIYNVVGPNNDNQNNQANQLLYSDFQNVTTGFCNTGPLAINTNEGSIPQMMYAIDSSFQDNVTSLNSLPNKTIESDKQELLTLLKTWKLESIFEHLVAENVYLDILKIIKRHHIERLLRKFDMGTQILFEHALENWRHSNGVPLDCPYSAPYRNAKNPDDILNNYGNLPSPHSTSTSSTSSVLRYTPYQSRASTPDKGSTIELANILNETSRGVMLTEYYKKFSKFTDEQRYLLINAIAQAFEEHNVQMTLATSYRIEKEILERFPTEKLEFYRTCKRGKIYNKCCNLKSSFKTAVTKHLVSKTEKPNLQRKSKQDEIPSVPENDAEDLYRSLKFDNLSSEVFDSIWKGCKQYRFRDLQELGSTTAILEKWPFYKYPSGFRLIEMDFNAYYDKADSLLKNWQSYQEMIVSFLCIESHVKDKNIRSILEMMKSDSDLNESNRDAAILWSLHGYFVPTNKIVKKDEALGKKVTTRFTIKDSQESFVYIGKCAQEVEDHLDFLVKQKQAIQPFILAVGENVLYLREIFVYFDGIRFSFNHFLRAVDICIKIFYIFNLDFPKKSQMFWNFIETFFYKLKSQNSYSKVHILSEYLLKSNSLQKESDLE